MPELMPYYGRSGDDPLLASSRGFVAPNVSDFGEVISAGQDDRRTATDWNYINQELAVRDAANQYAAKQEFQRRVAAGEDPVEAIRQLGPNLFSDLRTYAQFLQSEVSPEIRDVGGVRAMRTGPRSWRPLTDPSAVTPEVRLLERDMDRLDRERRTLMGKESFTLSQQEQQRIAQLDGEIAAIRGRIAEATEPAGIPSPMIEPVPPEALQPRGRFDEQQEMFNQLANPSSQLQQSRNRTKPVPTFQQAVQEARDAVARGADREAVRRRLQEQFGIDVAL